MSEPDFLYKSRNAAEAQALEESIAKLSDSYVMHSYSGSIEISREHRDSDCTVIESTKSFSMELKNGKTPLLIKYDISAEEVRGDMGTSRYTIMRGNSETSSEYTVCPLSNYISSFAADKDEHISVQNAPSTLELIALDKKRVVVRAGNTYIEITNN